jgi:hypothetical protein
MAASGNYNMDDPAKQEQIRRGPHEYIPSAGKHGTYVARPFKQQEYPKMMGKWPRPQLKDFLRQNGVEIPQDVAAQQLQAAIVEWDQRLCASIVHSKAEEVQWLKENG